MELLCGMLAEGAKTASPNLRCHVFETLGHACQYALQPCHPPPHLRRAARHALVESATTVCRDATRAAAPLHSKLRHVLSPR